MTRLWDKGTPLDARVLAYTAGEDHLLDNRLVRYDIRASIAHAEMLAEQGLLSAADLERHSRCACGDRRRACARTMAHHARARGLPNGDREPADGAHRRGRRAPACRPLAQRSSAGCAAPVLARRRRNPCTPARSRWPERSTRWRCATAPSHCPATPTCSRPCRARSRCGPRASPPKSATMRRACSTRSGARQEPAWVRCGIRHAEPRCQPRIDAAPARLCRHARTGHRGAVIARQGRGAAVVRDHAAHARTWDVSPPTCCCSIRKNSAS